MHMFTKPIQNQVNRASIIREENHLKQVQTTKNQIMPKNYITVPTLIVPSPLRTLVIFDYFCIKPSPIELTSYRNLDLVGEAFHWAVLATNAAGAKAIVKFGVT